jgi:single-strand DNA-binding protein
MKDKNSVQLIGYAGADPSIKNFQNGNKLARLRIATHARVKKKTEQEEQKYSTCWHTFIAWDQCAAFAERNFLKGSHILVDGYIIYRSYENSKGVKVSVTEIKATSLTNLDR